MSNCNIFTVRGVIKDVGDPYKTPGKTFSLVRVMVDITDEFDLRHNIVPFTINETKRTLPDGLAVGDIVDIQFRIGSYEFGRHGRIAANLRIGKMDIVRKACELQAEQEKNEIDQLAEYLVRRAESRRKK